MVGRALALATQPRLQGQEPCLARWGGTHAHARGTQTLPGPEPSPHSPVCLHTHVHTQTRTHTHVLMTKTRKHTLTQTCPRTHTCAHTDTDTHTCPHDKDPQAHTHVDVHTRTHSPRAVRILADGVPEPALGDPPRHQEAHFATPLWSPRRGAPLTSPEQSPSRRAPSRPHSRRSGRGQRPAWPEGSGCSFLSGERKARAARVQKHRLPHTYQQDSPHLPKAGGDPSLQGRQQAPG